MAAIQGWEIINPDKIKALNSLLLENKPIAVLLPEDIYLQYYAGRENIIQIKDFAVLHSGDFAGAVVLGISPLESGWPVLWLKK